MEKKKILGWIIAIILFYMGSAMFYPSIKIPIGIALISSATVFIQKLVEISGMKSSHINQGEENV